MKKVLITCAVLFLGAVPASAHDLFVTNVDKPYEVVDLNSDIDLIQAHLGNLDDFPVMYQFVVSSSSVVNMSLRQKYNGSAEPLPFGLMLVRQDDRGGGVTEVVRFNPESENWFKIKSASLGLSFWESEPVVQELAQGVYRLEVSTPINKGKYILNIGQGDESDGYFESLSHARVTQDFFGYSIFRMLTSSLVYYPLGIIFLLFIINRTWKVRKLISHGD